MHSTSFESYKYIHEPHYECSPEHVLENTYKTIDEVVGKMVVYSTGGGYRVYNSYESFLYHLSTMAINERVFHEVIFDIPQKLKFDIDAALDKLEAFQMNTPPPIIVDDVINDPYIIQLLEDIEADISVNSSSYCPQVDNSIAGKYSHILSVILQAIRDMFFIIYEQSLMPADEIICVSQVDDGQPVQKYSNHIIIANYYVTNHSQAHEFTRRILESLPAQYRPFIDVSVNKSIQNFRIVGCHKTNDNRIKRICTNHAEADTLITNVNKCKLLPDLITAPIKPPQNGPTGLHPDDLAAIIELCYRDVHIKMAHKYQCSKGPLLIFYRIRSSDCEFCKRTHTTDNTLIVSTITDGCTISVFKHCRRYKAEHGSLSIKLGEVPSSVLGAAGGTPIDTAGVGPQPATQGTNKATCYVDHQIIRALAGGESSCRPHRTLFDDLPAAQINQYSAPQLAPFELVPTLVVKAAMKMGKTKTLTKHITEHFTDGIRKQIIRFVSFRQTFSSNIKEKFPNFILYSDVKGPLNAPRLIVQVESIYRLDIREGIESPDLLVLDECESIFEQFDSGLLRGNLTECFSKFQYLLRYSKHVICMDANVSDRTFRILSRIRTVAPITYHHNTYCNATEDTYYIGGDKMKWLGMLYDSVAKGDKISIPTSSLAEAKILLKGLSERFPEKTIKLYSSETTISEKRAHFFDVNTHWAQFDILIYTPTVSAGVSFEEVHFDKIFGYFTDLSCPIETCQQMIGRVRNVANHQFIICLAATGNCLSETIEDIRDDIYRRRENLMKNFDETGLRTEYGPNGEITYHTTDFFYLWLENTRIKNLSKNSFVKRFAQMIMFTGATVHLLDNQVYLMFTGRPAVNDTGIGPADHLVDLWDTHYQLRREIRDEFCENVAQAPDMSPTQIEEVQDLIMAQKDITEAQRYSFERYRLRTDYNYEGQIDAAFVHDYHNTKVRRVYKNLTRLVSYNTTEEAWRGIQIEERVIHNYLMSLGDFSQYQDLSRKYVADQHRYALSLLRLCGWINVDDPSFIHMNTLKYSIETSQYWESIADACKEFEVKPPKKQYADTLEGDPGGWLKYILRPVNKILMIMYGILIAPLKGQLYIYKQQREIFFAKTREISLSARMPYLGRPDT